ncbi:hypothetical protein M758_8G040100 [Ceratodon purpureus]|nr:hypothetical protein M758_8G040100 [Ceratodon purpureus]
MTEGLGFLMMFWMWSGVCDRCRTNVDCVIVEFLVGFIECEDLRMDGVIRGVGVCVVIEDRSVFWWLSWN